MPVMRENLLEILACPSCRVAVRMEAPDRLVCDRCGRGFDVRGGAPVMLSEQRMRRLSSTLDHYHRGIRVYGGGDAGLVARIRRLLKPPSTTLNTAAARNYRNLRSLLASEGRLAPTLLLLGGGDRSGVGLDGLGEDWVRQAVNLEVTAGPGIDVVGDGHELPFLDGTMDAVIAQAVLEHVENPQAVVAETWRILRPGGLVYAEIPFLQCYHPHPTDYTRLTIDGVDLLFSAFDKLGSGVCVGPSSTMSDMLKYYIALLVSFRSERLFQVLHRGLGWLTFPLKYLDLFLDSSPNAAYMASGFYFLGRKRPEGGP